MFVLLGCPESSPGDDDDATHADDDTTEADDDSVTEDPCAGSPGEVLCVDGVAIHCSEEGITESTELCDPLCCEGLGCSLCCPGATSCLDQDVATCGEDGLEWLVTDICDVDGGFACRDGACVDLCQEPDENNGNRGCIYFTVDLPHVCDHFFDLLCSMGPPISAIAVVNDNEIGANIIIEEQQDGVWTEVGGGLVAERSGRVFDLGSKAPVWAGLYERFAFRLTSTIPVFAFQFQPPEATSSNEGMALVPVDSMSTNYVVKDWCCSSDSLVEEQQDELKASLIVVGIQNDTEVDLILSVATEPADDLPAIAPGELFEQSLQEGDVLHLRPEEYNTSFDNTLIESSLPVAAFVGHPAAVIPSYSGGSSGHAAEQLLGRGVFGTDYVAARIFPRNVSPELPEDAMWHLTAGDEAVDLTFTADLEVNGLPIGNQAALAPGETLELFVDGSVENPGDFHVEGTAWFSLTQYMTSSDAVSPAAGDACMVQTVPPDRFRSDYAIYALEGWGRHELILTRQPDVPILLDDLDIDLFWEPTIAGISVEYEVLRVPIDEGVHFLESTSSFGLLAAGEEFRSPYCFLGGFR